MNRPSQGLCSKGFWRAGDRVVAEHRRSGGEFRHVEPCDIECASGVQALKDMGSVIGPVIRKNAGAASADLSLAVEHVLVCKRDTMYWPAQMSGGQFPVRPFGSAQSIIGVATDERTMCLAEGVNPIETHARHFARGEATIGNPPRNLAQIQVCNLVISRGRTC